MVFSSDGTLLVTANWDGFIRVYDVRDPRKPREKTRLDGHDGQVQAVQLTKDGRTLVSGRQGRHDPLLGPCRRRHHPGPHRRGPHRSRAQPRAERGGHRHRLRVLGRLGQLLELATGAHLGTVDPSSRARTSSSDSVAFSPDGRMMATGADNGEVRLWDVTDPRKPSLLSSATDHVFSVHTLAFSPDGRFLASGGGDKSTRLWDVRDQKLDVAAALRGHTDTLWSLAFSSDSRYLVSTSTDTAVRLLDVGSLTYPRHSWTVWDLAYDGRDRFFATASADGSVKLWRPDGPARPGAQQPSGDTGERSHRGLRASPSRRARLVGPYGSHRAVGHHRPLRAPPDRRGADRRRMGRRRQVQPRRQAARPRRRTPAGSSSGASRTPPRRCASVSSPSPPSRTWWSCSRSQFTEDDRTLAIAGGNRQLELWDVARPRAAPRPTPASPPTTTHAPSSAADRRGGTWSMTTSPSTATSWRSRTWAAAAALYGPRRSAAQPRAARHPAAPGHRRPAAAPRLLPRRHAHIAAGTTDDASFACGTVRSPAAAVRCAAVLHRSRRSGCGRRPSRRTSRTLATTGTDTHGPAMWDIDVEATAYAACARLRRRTCPAQHWEHYFPWRRPEASLLNNTLTTAPFDALCSAKTLCGVGVPRTRQARALLRHQLADAARGLKLPTSPCPWRSSAPAAATKTSGKDAGAHSAKPASTKATLTMTPPSRPLPVLRTGRRPVLRPRTPARRTADKLDQHRVVLVTGASDPANPPAARRPARRVRRRAHRPGRTVDFGDVDLLVVDQAEELFTLHPDPRTAFIQRLLHAGGKEVIGLRADFYGHCAQHPELVDAIEDAQVLAAPMTTDELRRAITQPAVQAAATLETALSPASSPTPPANPAYSPTSRTHCETWRGAAAPPSR